ncbi:hypothetical protein ACF1B0_04635 [Streptomyces anandii]|uniref:hypothetical protein n=1 Tax=Streptomyces anandii TaxID=285454 RepID=UPI0036FEE1C0
MRRGPVGFPAGPQSWKTARSTRGNGAPGTAPAGLLASVRRTERANPETGIVADAEGGTGADARADAEGWTGVDGGAGTIGRTGADGGA